MAKANNTSYYVYLHRKKSNGQVFYVGKGHGNRHKDKCSRNKYWHNTVEKHGYTVEIYLDGLQEWYAFELEIQLIAYYGRENICNFTDGGEGSSGFFQSLETITKRSESNKGKKRTKEIVDKMKISQSFRHKKIYCSNGMVFVGYPDAIKWLKSVGFYSATASSLCNCCKKENNRLSAYGLKWSFENNFNNSSKCRFTGKIKCSNGMIFNSNKHAIDWLKSIGKTSATSTRISSVCKWKRATSYGFTWNYVEF